MQQSFAFRVRVLLLILCMQLAMLKNAAASGGKIIYTFAGGTDGATPTSDLILDAAGNLYGTTSAGGSGTSNCGTVFELIRNGSNWKHQVLYSFNGYPSDGCGPGSGLVFDGAGNLYGTTAGGGANEFCFLFAGCGTVFKLIPNSQGGWNESVLYSFGSYSGDGNDPNTDLVLDSGGNLYGTTLSGGQGCSGFLSYGCGTIFQLKPQADGTWVKSTIYAFAGGGNNDGAYPASPVLLDAQGNIYGATVEGGTSPCNVARAYQGCGAIYQLTPNSTGGWTEKLLYSFHRYQGTAVFPSGALLRETDNQILGLSSLGGNGAGAVFQLTLTKNGLDQTVLYRFYGSGDGVNPIGRLALGSNGHFFGVTSSGGSLGPLGYGTVFELVPTKNRFNRWEEHVLFNGDSTDAYPQAGPVVDSEGHVFGTFSGRYSSSFGSIYEVVP